MSLNTAGACFLPYGFEKQSDGSWVAFNREYFPLFISVKLALTDKKLAGLPLRQPGRDDDGINLFFLYGDDSAPWLSARAFRAYNEILGKLITAKVTNPPRSFSPDLWKAHWHRRGSILKWNTLGESAKGPSQPPVASR